MTNVPQKAENSGKAAKQNLTQIPAEQPSVVQLWLAEHFLNVEHGKEGVAQKVEPKAGYELAQLLVNSREQKSPYGAGKATRPQTTKPDQIIDQKQTCPEATSPKTSEQPLITETTTNKGENANRIKIPDTRPLPAKGLDYEKSGEGFTLQPLIRARHRMTTADGKPEDVPVSNIFASRQKPALAGEGLTPKALVDASVEITNVIQKQAVAGKPDVPAVVKKPLSNSENLPVQDKPSGLQPQPVEIGLKQFTQNAGEGIDKRTNPTQQGQIFIGASTDDNATAVQPRRPGAPQLTRPLADDSIEQGDNLQGKSASQQLNHSQFHVSAGQTKDRGSSVSVNNSDSGFEQVLSCNNTETYIEEQTSIFPEAVKTDNLPTQTSPGGVSASITEQILESIQSSSSQQAGTQQITIRLHPPELGKVFIKFEEQENQLTGLVEVSKAKTRYEVEQALPQIVQNLADCGIQIRRLEVMLTDQNGQQSYGDELLQNGLFQQHHDLPEWDNPDQPGAIGANEPGIFENNSNYQDGLGPQMQITAESINILI
jgi:flagellar hook-length control protein FliK